MTPRGLRIAVGAVVLLLILALGMWLFRSQAAPRPQPSGRPHQNNAAGTSANAAASATAAASGAGLRPQGRAGGGRPAPVIVQPVKFEVADLRIEAVGTARARRAVVLHPAAAGEVTAVRFRAGQRVRAGDVLLQLDARRERLAVEQARVGLREAQDLLRRYERTGDIGAVSESQIEQARTAVASARIELSQAEVALADRTVRAPFAGHVGFTDLDPGDRVQTDTEITTLDDRDELLVDFTLPEVHLGALRAGLHLLARPWGESAGEPLAGVVDTLGTRVDPQSRNVAVRARLANPGGAVLPGRSFRIEIALPGRRLPSLPEAAIVWGNEGSALWRVRDGRAARLPAVIVQRREGVVLVDAALKEGDPVVVEGVQRLRDGLPVQVQGGSGSGGGR